MIAPKESIEIQSDEWHEITHWLQIPSQEEQLRQKARENPIEALEYVFSVGESLLKTLDEQNTVLQTDEKTGEKIWKKLKDYREFVQGKEGEFPDVVIEMGRLTTRIEQLYHNLFKIACAQGAIAGACMQELVNIKKQFANLKTERDEVLKKQKDLEVEIVKVNEIVEKMRLFLTELDEREKIVAEAKKILRETPYFAEKGKPEQAKSVEKQGLEQVKPPEPSEDEEIDEDEEIEIKPEEGD